MLWLRRAIVALVGTRTGVEVRGPTEGMNRRGGRGSFSMDRRLVLPLLAIVLERGGLGNRGGWWRLKVPGPATGCEYGSFSPGGTEVCARLRSLVPRVVEDGSVCSDNKRATTTRSLIAQLCELTRPLKVQEALIVGLTPLPCVKKFFFSETHLCSAGRLRREAEKDAQCAGGTRQPREPSTRKGETG